eukprot:2399904-Prorocentrum_lima.AAC.1
MAAARTRRSTSTGIAQDAEIATPTMSIPRIASGSSFLPRRQLRRPQLGRPWTTLTRSMLDTAQ